MVAGPGTGSVSISQVPFVTSCKKNHKKITASKICTHPHNKRCSTKKHRDTTLQRTSERKTCHCCNSTTTSIATNCRDFDRDSSHSWLMSSKAAFREYSNFSSDYDVIRVLCQDKRQTTNLVQHRKTKKRYMWTVYHVRPQRRFLIDVFFDFCCRSSSSSSSRERCDCHVSYLQPRFLIALCRVFLCCLLKFATFRFFVA